MPARITVYCRKSVLAITASELQAGLDLVDWHTLAEGYEIDDEVVESALRYFQIQGQNGAFTLHCRPPQLRQIEITIIDATSARAAIDEIITELGAAEDRVAEQLRRTITVVEIETGYFQFIEMLPVLAFEVAMWFAALGAGWILTDNGEWWSVDADLEILYRGLTSGD